MSAASELDAIQIVRQAAEKGDFAEFLEAVRAHAAPLVIAVNDPHRATDSRSALEALCRIAEAQSYHLQFQLVVACGSHLFNDTQVKSRHVEAILGGRQGQCAGIEWHDARNPAGLAQAGGRQINRRIAAAPLAAAIGSLEPHYFAGATGAHKTLTAGVAGLETLTANHALALSPAAAPLRLRGNPVYEDLAAWLRGMQNDGRRFFAVNEISSGGALKAAAAGDPLDTLEQALPMLQSEFGVGVDAPLDYVVSMVRPPLDRDLYQADKGIKNVEGAVRDGGAILLVAPCAEGVGLDRFLQLLRQADSHRAALDLIRRDGYRLGDHKAVRLLALRERGVRLGLIARGLNVEQARAAGMTLLPDRRAGDAWLHATVGGHARGMVVDDAGSQALFVRDPNLDGRSA